MTGASFVVAGGVGIVGLSMAYQMAKRAAAGGILSSYTRRPCPIFVGMDENVYICPTEFRTICGGFVESDLHALALPQQTKGGPEWHIPSPNWDNFATVLHRLISRFPSMAQLPRGALLTGAEMYTPDIRPLVDEFEQANGYYIVNGKRGLAAFSSSPSSGSAPSGSAPNGSSIGSAPNGSSSGSSDGFQHSDSNQEIYTPQDLLQSARHYLEQGDDPQSAEQIWFAAVFALKILLLESHNIDILSHDALIVFSRESLIWSGLPMRKLIKLSQAWMSAEQMHSYMCGNCFLTVFDFDDVIDDVEDLITSLAAIDRRLISAEFEKKYVHGVGAPNVSVKKVDATPMRLGGKEFVKTFEVMAWKEKKPRKY